MFIILAYEFLVAANNLFRAGSPLLQPPGFISPTKSIPRATSCQVHQCLRYWRFTLFVDARILLRIAIIGNMVMDQFSLFDDLLEDTLMGTRLRGTIGA